MQHEWQNYNKDVCVCVNQGLFIAKWAKQLIKSHRPSSVASLHLQPQDLYSGEEILERRDKAEAECEAIYW